jgi:predicted PurR-regulated permease PerM
LWYFSLIAALIVVYKLCDNLGKVVGAIGFVLDILAPFVAGLILAFLLHHPTRWLEKQVRKLKGRFWQVMARPLSLTAVYLLLLGVVALLISLVLPHLATSLTDLIRSLPGYMEAAIAKVKEMVESGVLQDADLATTLDSVYQSLFNTAAGLLSAENVMSALRSVINVTASLVDIVIAIIVSVYMLAGREHLMREAKALCGLFARKQRVQVISRYGHRVATIVYQYFYGALLDALVVGVVVSVGLSIFRVPYAVLLGMLLGLLNMIPYFGAIIGCVGIALVTLLTNGFPAALGVVIFIIVVQQVDANIIQPRVVGDSVGLRPIYVLLAITLFGGLFGFWGIFLGVPLMAIIQMFVKDAIAAKRENEKDSSDKIEE